MNALNGLDYALLMVLLLSSVLGLFRGLVREVLSLLAWVVAFWLAQHYARPFSEYLPMIDQSALRQLAAFLLIFLATLITISLLNRLLSLLIRVSHLGALDRILGGIFGALRGVIIGVVFMALSDYTPLAGDAHWQGSVMGDYYRQLAHWAVASIPSDFQLPWAGVSLPVDMLDKVSP